MAPSILLQIAASVLCLGQVATSAAAVPAPPMSPFEAPFSLHDDTVSAPIEPLSSERIEWCHFDGLPSDCLAAICRHAGPRATLALRLTSRSLNNALHIVVNELREFWMERFTIRAAFPSLQCPQFDLVDEIPADALILGAFEVTFGQPLMRIESLFGLQHYRTDGIGFDLVLLMLDRNLNLVSSHLLGDQEIVTADTIKSSPYYCIKGNDLIKFYDGNTAEVIYEFVCEDAVSYSGDIVLCHNRNTNEISLLRIDFQAQEHRCLWTQFLSHGQDTAKISISHNAILNQWFENDIRHFSLFNVESGDVQWQTTSGILEFCKTFVSESVVTTVRYDCDDYMKIEHYDIHTGRRYEKDPQRASELLGTASSSAVVMATDECMIWSIDHSQYLMIIDFVLGSISIAIVDDNARVGVAFRESPFGPIQMYLAGKPDVHFSTSLRL